MTIPLELGAIHDPSTRRALEQISLHSEPVTVPVVNVLPATATVGQLIFLTTDGHLYIYSGGWNVL